MMRPSAANGIVPTHMIGISAAHCPAVSETCWVTTAARTTSSSAGSTRSSDEISLVTMIIQLGSGVIWSWRSQPLCRSCDHGTAVDMMEAASAPYAAIDTMRITLARTPVASSTWPPQRLE